MKKDTLIKGAMIATASTILIKVLGVIYTIPLNTLIGEQGGALYGFGYQVYNSIATIAMVGIPLAVSKIIAKYQSLGYYKTGERVFSIGKKLLLATGIIGFIIMFMFAEHLAPLIIGDLSDSEVTKGNTIADIVLIIRIMSITLIAIPYMSVLRGYLQGNRFITPTSYSQMIEQIVRILFILVGGYLVKVVFDLGTTATVGIATFAAFAGGVASLIYLQGVIKRNRPKFSSLTKYEEQDPEISNYYLLKELIIYALPFMLIALNRQMYNNINLFTMIRQLRAVGYTEETAEAIYAIAHVYGFKLTAIITAVSSGFTISLIPAITKSFTEKDQAGLDRKINQIFSVMFFLVVPMALGLSLLNEEMYFVFYGYSEYGSRVFSVLVLITIITSFANISTTILQVMNRFSFIFISIIIGLGIKLALNYPMIMFLENQYSAGYHGAQVATMIGYSVTMILNMIYLGLKMKVNLKKFILNSIKTIILVVVMVGIVIGIQTNVPIKLENRLIVLIYSGFVALIAGGVYMILAFQIKLFQDVFGTEMSNKLTNRLKKFKS